MIILLTVLTLIFNVNTARANSKVDENVELQYYREYSTLLHFNRTLQLEVKDYEDFIQKCVLNEVSDITAELEENLENAKRIKNHKDQAFAYRDDVFSLMEKVRVPVDELEKITNKSYWPIPTYGDLLFEV